LRFGELSDASRHQNDWLTLSTTPLRPPLTLGSRFHRNLTMKRFFFALPALAAALALAGCMTTSPDVVQPYHAQRMSTVHDATVLTIRPVTVDGQQTGTGAVAGGVVGGIAGSSVGGPRESAVVGILGAVAGAVIGNAIERDATKENAFEIIVQLRNGERRAIVQAKGSEQFAPGDPVVLVTTGGRTRVMRAPAGMPSSSAAPMPPPVASNTPPPAQGASAPIYTPR
jgi:outer membrane lipoprotein SlyB